VPTDFLEQQKVPLEEMPIWAPAESAEGGVNTHSNRKIVAAGLTYRSLADTTRDTLAWYWRLPMARRYAKLRAGIAPEREVEVLAAWHAKQKK
jgi:2'-hydroxyisoflavone reductase